MTERVLVLADPDRRYAEAFLSYASEYTVKWSLDIRVFCRPDLLISYLEDRRPAILLVSEKLMTPETAALMEGRADCCLVLTEGQRQNYSKTWGSVCKYQSVPNLIRRVVRKYAAGKGENHDAAVAKATMTVIGFYSPLGGCLQTSLSCAYGELAARKRPCLWMNLEGSSGFAGLMERHFDKDLSDFMGELADGKAHLSDRLQLLTHTVGGLDYLPPVAVSQDIFEAAPSILRGIVTLIRENTAYETLVIDFGGGAPGLLELLMMCDAVYVPKKSDRLSEEKIKEFMKTVTLWDRSLAEKIRLFDIGSLPPCGLSAEKAECLAEGVLGRFIEDMGLGEENDEEPQALLVS